MKVATSAPDSVSSSASSSSLMACVEVARIAKRAKNFMGQKEVCLKIN